MAKICARVQRKSYVRPRQNLLPVKHIPKRSKSVRIEELEALFFADNGQQQNICITFCIFRGGGEALQLLPDLDFEN